MEPILAVWVPSTSLAPSSSSGASDAFVAITVLVTIGLLVVVLRARDRSEIAGSQARPLTPELALAPEPTATILPRFCPRCGYPLHLRNP